MGYPLPVPQKLRQVELKRRLPTPPEALWPLLGDTNRLDRATGMSAVSYHFEQRDGRRVRLGESSELGIRVRWVEEPYEWAEGRFVSGERRFLGGPAVRGGLRVELQPDGEGTLVRALWHFEGRGFPGRIVGPRMASLFRNGLGRVLDELAGLSELSAQTLGSIDPTKGDGDAPRPSPRTTLLGPRQDVDVAELGRRAKNLPSGKVAPELLAHLSRLLGEAPDEAVGQMRPFALASAWNESRRDTLAAFLHATRVGLVDLRWQVDCPVCRVSASVHERLEDVRSEVHCDACGVDYGVGFGEHVEAVFQANPAIRRTQTRVFCASTPAFRKHVFSQLAVEPGDPRTQALRLPRGEIVLRFLGQQEVTRADIPDATGRLEVRLEASGLTAHFEPTPDAEEDEIHIESALALRQVVQFERADWNADAALGSIVATFPEFRDLFATEAPAAGVDLEIGYLALLFSDLVGSTALYGRIGDARAYALVQEHFDLMAHVIAEHDGSVVKTMGDAVMASFASATHAVAAAREMVTRHDARFEEDELGLKIGVHAGACLAVRANETLDFFGSTVNMAARLQAKAATGELVMTEALSHEEPIAALLEGYPSETFEARLKGIDPVPRLRRVHLDQTA